MFIPSPCNFITPSVQFSVKNGVIRRDHTDNQPGTEIFYCMAAQSREEFVYEIRKVRPHDVGCWSYIS